jgi:hypothetical protein
MLIRFWGTRGSIPVALTGAGVRSKIKQRSVTKLRAIKIPTFQVCEEQCTIFL